MKATLEYTLPEETDEYEVAINGHKYAAVIEDLSNWLRGMYKYEDKETVSIAEVREKIVEELNARGL